MEQVKPKLMQKYEFEDRYVAKSRSILPFFGQSGFRRQDQDPGSMIFFYWKVFKYRAVDWVIDGRNEAGVIE